ncbi:anti-sigma factor family protein [Ramlibacter sp. AN1133]|uniref:anti-sigma factor family protein n=1 Tax=Ramlibacter sp. AN1133 TaxID=3133429 RepID=UPI0030BEED55
MRADTETLQVNAYVDAEMDLASQLRFEERLRLDAGLRAQVQDLRGQSEALREGAQYHVAPAHLRALVSGLAKVPPAPGASGPRPWRARVRAVGADWFAIRPLATGLAVASIVAAMVNPVLLRSSDAERLQRELVASHVRATMAQRSIDVASSDQHTVKPWFATQLDYSPPVRPLEVPGTVILGGRVDYVDGRRVAVIVYQHGRHLVDHYIWPTRQADDTVKVTVVDGIRIAQWSRGGMAHKLVSDMDPEELRVIVQACRQQEEKG